MSHKLAWLGGVHGQLVDCRLDELRPHPSYIRHNFTVPASQLSTLVELGDLAFRERIVITQDRTIIDGYARVKLAQLQERQALPCIVYELTETQALQSLLQRHLQSSGWNAFTRGQLAMDLEPGLREKAISNQRAGGQNKGSSILTEAEKVDVRAKIAEAAHLSVGTISKVNQLLMTATPELLQALRNGEVRIDRAWKWSKKSPEEQREALWRFQSEKRYSQDHTESAFTVPVEEPTNCARAGRLDQALVGAPIGQTFRQSGFRKCSWKSHFCDR